MYETKIQFAGDYVKQTENYIRYNRKIKLYSEHEKRHRR
jgi:hypothetical protein